MLYPQAWRISTVLSLVIAATLGCSSSDSTSIPDVSLDSDSNLEIQQVESLKPTTDTGNSSNSFSKVSLDSRLFPEVELKTNKGTILLKLNAQTAPSTVDNFLTNYVSTGHYDNTIFHFVDSGFMILGGIYTSDKKAKPTKSEIQNEAKNGLKNKRGTIAMARDPKYIHSSTCQFFINLADNDSLDYLSDDSSSNYGYCVFGEVIQGMDIVDQIAQVPVEDTTEFSKTPVDPVIILSAKRIK